MNFFFLILKRGILHNKIDMMSLYTTTRGVGGSSIRHGVGYPLSDIDRELSFTDVDSNGSGGAEYAGKGGTTP